MPTTKKAEEPSVPPQAVGPEESRALRVIEPYLTLPTPPTREEMVKQAEDQIFVFKEYMRLFSQEVRPEQVLLFGEEIYLPARACQTLLGYARLRLKIHSPIVQHRFQSPDGEFIVFEAHGTVCHRDGTEIDDVVASQSTRDEFFGISGKEYVCPFCQGPTTRKKDKPGDQWDSSFCATHGKVKAEQVTHYLPLYDVPIDDVLKKTTTNLFNRALKAIGMMPTIEDLQKGGMDISKVKRIGFKSDTKKPPQQNQPAMQTVPQSNQQKPSASTPPETMAAPRAVIPPQNWGPVEAFELRKTKSGTEYGKLRMNQVEFYVFDNKKLDVGGTRAYSVFELLDMAAHGHWICTFTIEHYVAKTSGKTGWRIVGATKMGIYEWDKDGFPIRRGEPAAADPGSFQASDEDFPEEMFDR